MLVLVIQLGFVVRAYSADHAFFGFQMFPESSEWQATIERELEDGTRIDIRDDWPGGYEWSDLVSGRGLSHPFNRHHADTGVRSTLHFFAAAVEWVAAHTPDDTESVRLIATVSVWHNGRPAEPITIAVDR